MSFEHETQINKIYRPLNDDWINNLRKRNKQLYSVFSKHGDTYSMYQSFILSTLLTLGEVNLNNISATLTIIEGQIDVKTFRRAYNDVFTFTTNHAALEFAIRKHFLTQ